MPDCGGHAADLPVLALDEFERKPGVGDALAEADRRVARGHDRRGFQQAGATWPGRVPVELEAAFGQLREGRGCRHAFHLGPVFAAMTVLWIQQLRIQAGLVCEQQESLGVGVEPTEWVNAGGQAKVGERAPPRARLRGELREHPVRFIQRAKHDPDCVP